MAKIKYTEGQTPIVNEHSGFTFQPNNYGQSMFPASRSTRKRYGSQWNRAHNNQKAVTRWREMSATIKANWNLFAATFPQPSKRDPNKFLTGYQLFIRRNSYCFLNHGITSDFMEEPEINELAPGTITFSIAWSEGAIDCTELFLKNWGRIPRVGDYVLLYAHIYAEYSGQFFTPVYGTYRVDEIYLDGLFVTVNIPDEMEQVTVSLYLSRVIHQSVHYTGTKCNYMGCFTKKKFTDLIDVPAVTPANAGNYWGVNIDGTWGLQVFSPNTIINVVNDYTTLVDVVNNYTVYDITTQMFYTYKVDTWVNVTINKNLIKIVQDHTVLINVENNVVVFDISLQQFFWYNVDVWVQIGGGGGGLTCEDLPKLSCISRITKYY